MVELDKKTLRKEVRAKLALLSDAEKERRSADMCHTLKSHIMVAGARVVALFSPLGNEPCIWPLVEDLSHSMVVVLPRVEGEIMNFYLYVPECMSCGEFGIMEPAGVEAVAPYEIDVMVVPGVAFTTDCDRMGRGKGFYDKYMSQSDFRAVKIGVCYAEQVVWNLPVEPHDVRMDALIYK